MSEMIRHRVPAWLRPSRRWLVVPPIMVGLAVIIGLATSRKEMPRRTAEERAIPVQVKAAKRESVTAKATGYGTVRAKRVWVAIAEVGGRLVQMHEPLRPGIFVDRGCVTVQIDKEDYELLKQQRTADLEQMQAELEQIGLNEAADRKSLEIQQELERVRGSDVDRLRSLRGSSAASANELDTAIATHLSQKQTLLDLETGLRLYRSQRLAAEARVHSAEAKLREAERDLQRTEITVPFAGLISQVDLEVGQYVSPGEVLFQLLDLSSVEIETQFSLDQWLRLFPESPTKTGVEESNPQSIPSLSSHLSAQVIVRSGDSVLKYDAKPIRLTDQVDSQSRTLGVVVEVFNDSFASNHAMTPLVLRPGMFCEVVLESKQRVDCFVVNRETVDQDAVYVVQQNNTGSRMGRRSVQVAMSLGSEVYINDGLDEGDLVILNPPLDSAEGMLVQPLFADQLGADQLGADQLGADHLGADHLGADHLGADHLDEEQPVALTRNGSDGESELQR